MANAVMARPVRKDLKGKEYKAAHKARMSELLMGTTLGYTWYSSVLKALMLFPPIFIVANCVTKGAYDFAWETGFSLFYLGGAIAVFGVLFPMWRIHRAKKKRVRTSIATWSLVGLMMVLLGLFYILSAVYIQVKTNYELWHFLAPNKQLRDDFGRTGLEGLYTGLLMSFVMWDPVKYELKGSFADRLLAWVHWPNSLYPDEVMPIRTWMVFVCPLIMAFLAGLVFAGTWGIDQLITSHAATINEWFKTTAHINLSVTTEKKIDHGLNFVFEHWWVWLAGYFGSKFLAQIPAKALIQQLQLDASQRRIIVKGGNLKKAFAWFNSHGKNAHIAIEYYEGVQEYLGLSNQTISEINEALSQVPRDEIDKVYGGSAAFSQKEVDGRDPGIMIPLKVIAGFSPVFFFLGLFFVYFPLINEHLHTHLPVFTHL